MTIVIYIDGQILERVPCAACNGARRVSGGRSGYEPHSQYRPDGWAVGACLRCSDGFECDDDYRRRAASYGRAIEIRSAA